MKFFQFFQHAFDTLPQSASYPAFLQGIRTGFWQQDWTVLIQQIRQTTDETLQKIDKNQLPRLAVNHYFEGGRRAENAREATYLLEIELDRSHNQQLDFVRQAVITQAEKGVIPLIACFWSVRKGLVLHFWVQPHTKRQWFEQFEQELAKNGYEPDKATLNTTYLRSFSYDPDIWIRETAQWDALLTIPAPAPKKTQLPKKASLQPLIPKTAIDKRVQAIVEEINTKEWDITQNRADWITMGLGLAHQYGEQGRAIFHEISRFYPKYKERETNLVFSSFLHRKTERPVTIGSFFHLAQQYGIEIPFEKWDKTPTETLTIAQKIGNDPQAMEQIIRTLRQHQITYLESPADSGKTFMTLRHLSPQFSHLFMAVPYKIQAQSIEAEYADLELISLYEGKHYAPETGTPARLMVSTYNQLPLYFDPNYHDCLVIDEAHLLSTDIFRQDVLQTVFQTISVCLQKQIPILLMSATPDHLLGILADYVGLVAQKNYKILKIRQEQTKTIRAELTPYKGNPYQLLKKLLQNFDFGAKQLLVRIDNKRLAEVLTHYLVQEKILEISQISTVFAFKRKHYSTRASEGIRTDNTIPADIRLTFATSIADVGLNLHNTNMSIVNFLTRPQHYTQTVQLPFRLRKIQEVDYHIFIPEKEQKIWTNRYLYFLASQAQGLLKEIRLGKKTIGKGVLKIDHTLCYLDKLVSYNDQTQQHEINLAYILGKVKELETQKMDWRNLQEKLQSFEGFEVQAHECHLTEYEPDKALEHANNTHKADRQVFIQYFFDCWKTDQYAVWQWIMNEYADYHLLKNIQNSFPFLTKNAPTSFCTQTDWQDQIVERLAKRYFLLKELALDDHLTICGILEQHFSSRQFGDWLRERKIQLIWEAEPLGTEQWTEAEKQYLANLKHLKTAIDEAYQTQGVPQALVSKRHKLEADYEAFKQEISVKLAQSKADPKGRKKDFSRKEKAKLSSLERRIASCYSSAWEVQELVSWLSQKLLEKPLPYADIKCWRTENQTLQIATFWILQYVRCFYETTSQVIEISPNKKITLISLKQPKVLGLSADELAKIRKQLATIAIESNRIRKMASSDELMEKEYDERTIMDEAIWAIPDRRAEVPF